MTIQGVTDPTDSVTTAVDYLSTEELGQLIDARLRTLYQPMVDIASGGTLGYESFVRGPSNHALEQPAHLFACAQRQGLMPDLEYHSQDLAIERFIQRGFNGKLFLNCEPTAFLDPSYPRHATIKSAGEHGLRPEQVVIELTADYFKSDFFALREALEHYRSQGFQTAIADLGTGHNSLRLWSEIQPEFVKLDQHFTRDINTSLVKQSFISAIAHLCDSLHTKLIATGVETALERDCLHELGVHIMQGYYFSHPEENPSAIANVPQAQPRRRNDDSLMASDLATWVDPIEPQTRLEAVWSRFEADPGCHAVPVVTDGEALGFLHRSQLYELFARPNGRSTYCQYPVSEHISTDSFIVPENTRLSELSRQITEEDDGLLQQHYIVVDKHGHYLGVGHSRDLLRKLSEQRLRVARHANPLTHLPGNVPTNEHVDELLRLGKLHSAAYVDIDAFKPFNDTFGYQLGDQIIIALAQLLQEHLRGRRFFIGHVGGDDFIVVATQEGLVDRLRMLQFEFTQAVQKLMRNLGLERDTYTALDRHNHEVVFNLPTVSIGVMAVAQQLPPNLDAFISSLAHIKRQAKRLGGSGIAETVWAQESP